MARRNRRKYDAIGSDQPSNHRSDSQRSADELDDGSNLPSAYPAAGVGCTTLAPEAEAKTARVPAELGWLSFEEPLVQLLANTVSATGSAASPCVYQTARGSTPGGIREEGASGSLGARHGLSSLDRLFGRAEIDDPIRFDPSRAPQGELSGIKADALGDLIHGESLQGLSCFVNPMKCE